MISVTIPVFNNRKYALNLLFYIENNIYLPNEIFLIDDGSSEDIKSLADQFKNLPIKYIRHDQNMGYNYSCNEGIKLSKGEYISVLNNDILINEYFFKKIKQAFLENPNAAIICPNTVQREEMISSCTNEIIFATKMKKREGWAWTARASFIKNIPPIPNFLRNYYGDDYIFHCAKLLNYNCLKDINNFCFHYNGATVKKTPSASVRHRKEEGILWNNFIPSLEKEFKNEKY